MVAADILNVDIFRFIAMFLDERSLCRWTQTCKSLWLSDHLLTEEAWKALCEKRWLRTKNLLRSTGAFSFKAAYHILSFRKLPPRGKYTEKRNKLFGYGCRDGVSVWLYLDHSSDCRPRMLHYQTSSIPVITIRLCIQNIRHDEIRMIHHQLAYNVLSKDNQELRRYNPKVIAFNGQEVDQYFVPSDISLMTKASLPSFPLMFLESMVISLDIECHEEIENEVDFLTSLAKIIVHTTASVSYPSPHERKIKVPCLLFDEDDICDQYMFLPRGLVVLKDNDASQLR